MTHLLFQLWQDDHREQRLLRANSEGDRRSMIPKFIAGLTGRASETTENFLSPEREREQERLDDQSRLRAFNAPTIFSAPIDRNKNTGNINLDDLYKQTPDERLRAFEAFMQKKIPQEVREKDAHRALFSLPLDQGRITTILEILTSMAGDRPNPIAAEALSVLNNKTKGGGRMYNLYEQWRDGNPDMTDTTATNPTEILNPSTSIVRPPSDELKGYITNIPPEERAQMLRDMEKSYRNSQTDARLSRMDALVMETKLSGSVEETKKRMEATNIVDNFNNLEPQWKLFFFAIGGLAVWKALKSENGLGRFALYSIGGYLAYDKLVNGNENALNDMAGGFKKLMGMSKEKILDLAAAVGLTGPRRSNDRISTMARFLEKNHALAVDLGMTQRDLGVLAHVNLGTIAEAFRPDMGGTELGGVLAIDDGQTMLASADAQYLPELHPRGKPLYDALEKQMIAMGMSSREDRKANVQSLKSNEKGIGKSIAHIFYMLAADRPKNFADVDAIQKGLDSKVYFDELDRAEKVKYMGLVVEGQQIARDEYASSTLMGIVTRFNDKEKRVKVRSKDTAARIENPKTPSRTAEFATYEKVRAMDSDPAHAKEITEDGGLLDLETQEFIRNLCASGLLENDAAQLLQKKFNKIREQDKPLTEIFTDIEALKYAVMVASVHEDPPLTKDKIDLLTGPDTLDASSILNTAAAYIAQYVVSLPRGFASVKSIGGLRSMLTEPWLGSGPLSSNGQGFDELKGKLDIYEKRMSELRDTKALSARIAKNLPSSVLTSFGGGKEEVVKVIEEILQKSTFGKRIDSMEKAFSERAALALVRTMRLTATTDGYGRKEELGITPKEQDNLKRELNRLFEEIVGDTEKGGDGMWGRAEDIKTMGEKNLAEVELALVDLEQGLKGTKERPFSLVIGTEKKRMDLIRLSRDMAVVYLMRREMKCPTDELDALRTSIGDRVTLIRNRYKILRDSDTSNKRDSEKIAVRNQASYREGIPQLNGILALLGLPYEMPFFAGPPDGSEAPTEEGKPSDSTERNKASEAGTPRESTGAKAAEGGIPNDKESTPADGSKPSDATGKPNEGTRPTDGTGGNAKEGNRPSEKGSTPADGSKPSDATGKPNEGTKPRDGTGGKAREGSNPSEKGSTPADGSKPSDTTGTSKEATQPTDKEGKENEGGKSVDQAKRPKEGEKPNDVGNKTTDGRKPTDDAENNASEGGKGNDKESKPATSSKPSDTPNRPSEAGKSTEEMDEETVESNTL